MKKENNINHPLDHQYFERVYAGVLGKIIGVYLGRPFEGWDYKEISDQLGEINYYVHEKLNVPLIVTDDDISGTFTFIRALEDYHYSKDITPAQIGQTWLNYIIEKKTILWWGGFGNSTEHTAFLRLKNGVQAPLSGSMNLNSKIVAEQIGAQIFIDGWAMVVPGEPEMAADLAKRAASVSHDGEAIFGAQVIAAMEAQAFVENKRHELIEVAISLIPENSLIRRMIEDLRELHDREPDWRKAFSYFSQHYGYEKYGGNCHMVPNHGLIIFSFLYGDDNFQKTMMIVNTLGWDTDCNAGNLGCLMGIKNGLEGINNGPDWRGPVSDMMYLPTADGGRSISDAATEAVYLANTGRQFHGLAPLVYKNGARFHFELADSVQGFNCENSIVSKGTATVSNVLGHSIHGTRSLAIQYKSLAKGRCARVETPTFSPSAEISKYFSKRGYSLLACPTIYSGQTIIASLIADEKNKEPVIFSLYLKHYNEMDEFTLVSSEKFLLKPGNDHQLCWKVPDTQSYPIAFIGLQLEGEKGETGKVYLDYLDWKDEPSVRLNRPLEREVSKSNRGKGPIMWKSAWVDGKDGYEDMTQTDYWPEPYRLIQNVGRGYLIQGTRQWKDYKITARMTHHMCDAGGIGIRVQGMTRYYALLIKKDRTDFIRSHEGKDTILATCKGGWKFGNEYELMLQAFENQFIAWINQEMIFQVEDSENFYTSGGMALISQVGRIGCNYVEIVPALT